jgi:orotate phosphoribosyltransferase
MKTRVAEILLDIGAVNLNTKNPFTWASGLQSPIYCDNRLLLSEVKERNEVISYFVKLIKENYSSVNVIAGVATAGIPHAALIADKLNLPLIYVRSKSKNHGLEKLIEGKILPEANVVIIEDLFSTGGSAINAADAVRQSGMKVLSILSIFSYQLKKASTAFIQKGYHFDSLSDIQFLLDMAKRKSIIGEDEVSIVEDFFRREFNEESI